MQKFAYCVLLSYTSPSTSYKHIVINFDMHTVS